MAPLPNDIIWENLRHPLHTWGYYLAFKLLAIGVYTHYPVHRYYLAFKLLTIGVYTHYPVERHYLAFKLLAIGVYTHYPVERYCIQTSSYRCLYTLSSRQIFL